ncbi:lantibiotic dehydratase [Actinomadura rudentiformis]|uniref:Lantibiotic dehydratase n=1 Tax=Actinomadura rudentiformis TaxID=359158 RepID=A0A6H9YPS7_9ACTN|nr:lantibiotic dehydratase [Actinomadura rudentiformis]KAB2344841.1 lantibiotic dehydratase [Actinomadura rudentiformis]
MYRYLDHALVRGSPWRRDTWTSWPDLSDHPDAPSTWRPWLREVMQRADFAAALDNASPTLFRRVSQLCDGQAVAEPAARRAVESVLRYMLRAASRSTPFGLFAGVAPARISRTGHARAIIGSQHRAVAGVDAAWLSALVERLESDPALWPWASVRVNPLAFIRDGRVVLEHRPQRGNVQVPVHIQLRASEPVRRILVLASTPIVLGDLATELSSQYFGTDARAVVTFLSGLLAHGILVTNLNPPLTRTDPLRHLEGILEAVTPRNSQAAADLSQLRALSRELRDINLRHTAANHGAASIPITEHHARLVGTMAGLCSAPTPSPNVDLRLGWEVTVPGTVAAEAAHAAELLVRLAPRSVLTPGWERWHMAFLERYGPRALVPLRQVVNADVGLGYPAGYLGNPDQPTSAVTDRDTLLFALVQRAAMDNRHEITLDEETIAALSATSAAIDPAAAVERRPQTTTEATVRVHAADEHAVQQGDFMLSVIGVSRSAGTTIGRFLPLLDQPPVPGDASDEVGTVPARPHEGEAPADLQATLADLPTSTSGALLAQLCTPPLHTGTANVARVPAVLPHSITIGQFHDDDRHSLNLDDLAVTADRDRLYLVSLSRRQVVETATYNAVEPSRYTHPLARFLAELPNALNVPCAEFDWGAAARLPFLPALRHGRAFLAPARWQVDAGDLPGPSAFTHDWDAAFAIWRSRVRLPGCCYLGYGDQRLGLDLDQPAHRAMLRAQLHRKGSASLRALPTEVPDARSDWCGGYAHELVIPLAAAVEPAPAPSWLNHAEPVNLHDHGRLPGSNGRLFLKLYGHPDRQAPILLWHVPDLLACLDLSHDENTGQYWFMRYQDPEPHLRLRLRVPSEHMPRVMAAVTSWSARLRTHGLIARLTLDTDFPETTRFGGPAALDSAEDFFATDSAAAVAQMAVAVAPSGPDLRAVTAASLLDLTVGFLGDAHEAARWLIEQVRSGRAAPPRPLYELAIALGNPGDRRTLTRLPGGSELLTCWAARRAALTHYRRVLDESAPATVRLLLPELLHLHHARTTGLDPEGERTCLHLARAAALSWSHSRTPKASATTP